MSASKRERWLMIAAALVLGALVLDQFIISPALAWRADLSQRYHAAATRLEEAQTLIAGHDRLNRRWRDMVAAGMRDSISDAEADLYHALRDWSRASGLQLQSILPERVHSEGELPHIVLRASAHGPMRAVVRFMQQVEEAPFPIRITQMQLASRRDGEDDLTLQLQLSTLVQRDAQEEMTQ